MAKDLVMAHIQAGQLPPENMQQALQRTYANLMALKAQEETGAVSPVQVSESAHDWKKSITKHTVTCLECGLTFKQLSVRHLREHDLDGRSYRAKFGIPRTQPLAAKDTTAMRKKIVQQTKPWEKAPMFVKAQEAKTGNGTTPKATKNKGGTKKRAAKAKA
jgi:predicted transcriptional regulator